MRGMLGREGSRGYGVFQWKKRICFCVMCECIGEREDESFQREKGERPVQFTEPPERSHQGENCGGFDEVVLMSWPGRILSVMNASKPKTGNADASFFTF
ncbi:hypothetical protein COLO4_36920 [Corchorus olitorius]|uniref:Uncharacterized protein n=1 Tax=Corchorus olitorius TaxID=93759 RepID=A0A1R3G487_9ROSI|nr:hypothetical protein COLO4_36920 [Corchorus olitorius]